jgi:hypothetical protein
MQCDIAREPKITLVTSSWLESGTEVDGLGAGEGAGCIGVGVISWD